MVRVAPINLVYNPRTLWFDPQDIDVRKNDPVVVETARGIEFGIASSDVLDVSEDEIKGLKSSLKPVLRIATQEDVDRSREMEERGKDALPVFKEMVSQSGVDMRPVSVEFLLDGDKAVFYFESEERVDFRDLVRKLASHFKVRVDMRQIGVRDEARIVGGIGHCGQELCCKRLGGELCPVSIRMAKEQDLSLNPQKISGLCGRLMCCLRYEYDAYKDFKSRAPKMNATIATPDGDAKVVDLDVPRESISLKVGDGGPIKVRLAEFEQPQAGARPDKVGVAAWEAATAESASGYRSDVTAFLSAQFTGDDKLAEKGAVRRADAEKPSSGDGRRERRRSSQRARRDGGDVLSPQRSDSRSDPARKPRRRRSTKLLSADEVSEVSSRKPSRERVVSESGKAGSESNAQTRSRASLRKSDFEGNSPDRSERRLNAKNADASSSRVSSAETSGGSAADAHAVSSGADKGSKPSNKPHGHKGRKQRREKVEGRLVRKGGASGGGSIRTDESSSVRDGESGAVGSHRISQGDRPRPGQRSSSVQAVKDRTGHAAQVASGQDDEARRPRSRRRRKPHSGGQRQGEDRS